LEGAGRGRFHHLPVLFEPADGGIYSNQRSGKTLLFALKEIFTLVNLGIAVISGLIGYAVFEYLRTRI
jgi:hypothetical protein